MPLWTTTCDGSHQPPGSPAGCPLYGPQELRFRELPLKSSANTRFQPGRSPAGIASPDGDAAADGGGGGGRLAERLGEGTRLGAGARLRVGGGAGGGGRPGGGLRVGGRVRGG